tara:strand:- start:1167 stop:1415 length:249 start_codon:yes stop_codon:yes gene_type:complete
VETWKNQKQIGRITGMTSDSPLCLSITLSLTAHAAARRVRIARHQANILRLTGGSDTKTNALTLTRWKSGLMAASRIITLAL